MGIYNEVIIPCPACGKIHKLQSKAAPGYKQTTLDKALPTVKADLADELIECTCGACWAIRVHVITALERVIL